MTVIYRSKMHKSWRELPLPLAKAVLVLVGLALCVFAPILVVYFALDAFVRSGEWEDYWKSAGLMIFGRLKE